MRRWALLLSFLSVMAWAESVKKPIRLSFNLIPVSELVSIVYGDILERDFVLSAEVASKQDLITLRLLSADKAQVKRALESALSGLGVEVLSQPGYDLIRLRPAAGSSVSPVQKDWGVMVYRPKYRSIQHFVDLLSGVLTGRFTSSGTSGLPSTISTDSKGLSEPVSLTVAIGKESDFLVFHGPMDEHKTVKGLLSQVDVPLAQVVIHGYLFEVSDLSSDESGIGLILEKSGFHGVLGTVTKTANFLSFSKLGIELIARNLAKDRRFNVVSNPSLVVSSGKSARLIVGDKVPVKTSAVIDKNGNPIENFEYQQSGVRFEVTPIIRESNRVSLSVSQILSQFSPNDFNAQSPTLHNRELMTELSVELGKPILLGGLKQSKYTETAQGFSFFPSWKFAKSHEKNGTEYVLLIQADGVSLGEKE